MNLQDEVGIFVQLSTRRVLFYSLGRQQNERRFSKSEITGFRAILPVFAALNMQHFGKGTRPSEDPNGGRNIDQALAQFGQGLLTRANRK